MINRIGAVNLEIKLNVPTKTKWYAKIVLRIQKWNADDLHYYTKLSEKYFIAKCFLLEKKNINPWNKCTFIYLFIGCKLRNSCLDGNMDGNSLIHKIQTMVQI